MQEKSLIIVLQNTLGTWEGNYKELLKNISLFAKENDSEVILSICKADALKTWGLQLYSKLESLVGKPDYMKCDLEAGVFISNTGYSSKWFTEKEIWRMRHDMKGMSRSLQTPYYEILHFKF